MANGYDNLTLFLLLVLTAIITHVLTIAMMPSIPMDNRLFHHHKTSQDSASDRGTEQEPLLLREKTGEDRIKREHKVSDRWNNRLQSFDLASNAIQNQILKSYPNQTNLIKGALPPDETLSSKLPIVATSSPTSSPAVIKNEKIAFGPKPKEMLPEISKTNTPVVNIWEKLTVIDRTHSQNHQAFDAVKTQKPYSSIYHPISTMPNLGESRWIGNDWFPPPGGRLFDIRGLKQVFGKYNILWVADPEFQLTYANLISLLHSSDDGITSSKLERSSIQPCISDLTLTACYEFSSVKLDYISTSCMLNIRDVISLRDLKQYHLLIVDFGQQEMHGLCPFVISEKQKIFIDVVQRLYQLHIPIVWTTMAWLSPEIISVNNKVRDMVAKSSGQISIFDYGAGMQRRHEVNVVYLKKKKKVFYSMPARMAYIQMLANHLQQNFLL